MFKKDLKLIASILDERQLKEEFRYALITKGGIVATDTRVLIKFKIDGYKPKRETLVSKKVLNLVATSIKTNEEAILKRNLVCEFSECDKIKFDCFHRDLDGVDYKYADYKKILKKKFKNKLEIDSKNSIILELARNNCFVFEHLLKSFIDHEEDFELFYNSMDDNESAGMVKIISERYEAVIMGFK